ncbi:MAG: DUF503 domain-containing protein [Deltaproteobacteria bacterium]|nr:DUF503 domain-containing protein [Deltaproteobacteria bacterium]
MSADGTLYVGVLRLRLHLPNAHSLKDRRALVRRALDRLRSRLPVSAAEVGPSERWQSATLGVVTVSGDRAVVQEALDRATALVASALAGEALVVGRAVDLQTHDALGPFGVEASLLEKTGHGEDEA